MTCSTEDGRLVIRIVRKADDPGIWEADEPEGDDIVVTLLSSDITDSLENAVFCAVDVYSGVDISQIDPGEILFRGYTLYWIDSVAEDGTIEYRDASDEITGMISFINIPGSDDYVAMDAESNSPMLTALDIVEMPLDDAAKMIVVTGKSLEETAVDTAGMADIIASEADMTLVVIRNGRVQEIRHYRDISVARMMADVRADGSDQ